MEDINRQRIPEVALAGAREVEQTWTPAAAAYSANDVFEGAKVLTGIGPRSGGLMLVKYSILEVHHTALIASEAAYELHFYNVTPPSALADNAAFDVPSGDRASYLGKISLGTPVDLGSTLWVETAQNKWLDIPKAALGNLYAYLVTVGAFTPTAAARKVRLVVAPG
jgi:hypothetical protein